MRRTVLTFDTALVEVALYSLSDLVNFGAAVWTCPNSCRLAVLHRDRLRVLHFDLFLVLQTVAFQILTVLIRDSVSGPDSPILGVTVSPIQPQFKLNSAQSALNHIKSGSKSTVEFVLCRRIEKHETDFFGRPSTGQCIAQTTRHHTRACVNRKSSDTGPDGGNCNRAHSVLARQTKRVVHR
jgi:hypothetical protein